MVDVYILNGYNEHKIAGFADKETEKVFFQIYSKKLPHQIQSTALRKLMLIDKANSIEDLRKPPANHLE